MKSSRPQRNRTKPLEYWNNERIFYDVEGDISYISTSNAVANSVLHEKFMDQSFKRKSANSLFNLTKSSDVTIFSRKLIQKCNRKSKGK